MNKKDIIVIGTSAGGFDALKIIVNSLPSDFAASILIVNHVPAYGLNVLPRFLSANSKLPAVLATEGGEIKAGTIYVAPADYHLLVERTRHTRLTQGPKENRFRPAIDPLFRSAAAAFGPRVVGVVLTGYLDDGTAGLWAIKECGGTSVVQHPDTAFAPGMPLSALRHVVVDHSVPLHEISSLLVRLTNEAADTNGDTWMSEQMQTEIEIAHGKHGPETDVTRHGNPSLFACPECHGVLLQLKGGGPVRFRCHTGHAFSLETLMADFEKKGEEAIWGAIRALEERVILLRRAAEALPTKGHQAEVEFLLKKAGEDERRANIVRLALKRNQTNVEEERNDD